MEVTVMPIVIGALGLEDLEISGQEETIQTTSLVSVARIRWRVLETWGDFWSLKFQWEAISLRWWEKLSKDNNNNNKKKKKKKEKKNKNKKKKIDYIFCWEG